MRHFFIDLENVRSYGLEGVLLLKPDDMVYVFYSDNANALTIPTIESLNESQANVKYIKTNYIGANAMDFQIVTLLGATIERDKTGSFYIISHDNGFKSAVKFCEGYFTGYSIITGVYANILLALNSEKGVKEPKTDNKSKNGAAAKTEGNSNKKSDNRPEKKTADNKTDMSEKDQAAGVKENASGKKKSNGKKHASQDKTEDGQAEVKTKKQGNGQAVQNEPKEEIQPEKQPENNTDNTDENQPENGKGKSGRNRRNRRRNKKTTVSTNVENNTGEMNPAEGGQAESADGSATGNTAEESEKKPGRRNRHGNGKKNSETENSEGSRQYVYNALSDFLSKSTIDMYARKIDEGIRKSQNRNELHEFFKQTYGSDEAEALYKIIASDFEDMKKSAK